MESARLSSSEASSFASATSRLERSSRRAASEGGLKDLNLSATVVAEPGSGGCKMAKVERAHVKGAWEGVDLNFTCYDAAAL